MIATLLIVLLIARLAVYYFTQNLPANELEEEKRIDFKP